MRVLLSAIVVFACVILAQCMWVKEMENPGVFQGDIMLDPDEKKKLNRTHSYASIIGGRWPGAKVPYVITSSIAERGRRAIYAAIAQYHKHTCIRFHERTNENEYLSFYRGGGCSSWVGHRWGRVNHVSLAEGCWYLGTAMHEIGHSLGFEHEQNRPDRDKHVRIIWNNIQRGLEDQFYMCKKSHIDSLGTPYDYQSMMHYGATAFGINYRRTIETIDPSKQHLIGYEGGASKIDIIQLNLMYCKGKPQPTPVCDNKNKDCEYWAERGECNGQSKDWMKDNCCLACRKTRPVTKPPLTAKPGTEAPKTAVPPGCTNDNEKCEEWAKRGECYTSHGHWMRVHCCKACREFGCPGACTDKDPQCSGWAEEGFCQGSHGAWMKCNCCQSCLDKLQKGRSQKQRTATGKPDYW